MPVERALRAVSVSAIGRASSFQEFATRGISVCELPRCCVELDRCDRRKLAILSWRWDIVDSKEQSLNIMAALFYAQTKALEFLLLDIVSLDQNRRPEELISDVFDFTQLFTEIPMIAAYDTLGAASRLQDWHTATRRPWIFHEIRLAHLNPSKITYVAHQQEQGSSNSTGFIHFLGRMWGTNYTTSLLLLLFNKVGIGQISDLKYIIPGHFQILHKCLDVLCRNDFLMVCCIICQRFDDDCRMHIDTSDPSLDLGLLDFDRISLSETIGQYPGYFYYEIRLDVTPIGLYYGRSKYNHYFNKEYVRYLEANPNALEIIYKTFDVLLSDNMTMIKDLSSRYSLRTEQEYIDNYFVSEYYKAFQAPSINTHIAEVRLRSEIVIL